MDNSVGNDCGSRGWDGQRKAKGENWNNCNRVMIKKIKKIRQQINAEIYTKCTKILELDYAMQNGK